MGLARTLKRLLVTALVLGLLATAGLAFAGHQLWQRFHEPYQGWDASVRDEQVLEVAPGTPGLHILAELERLGVLRDQRVARAYLVYYLGDPPLKKGEYRFTGPMTGPEVLDKLVRGEVRTYPLTLIEGLDLEETARAIADQGFGDLDLLLAEVRDPSRIADLDPDAENLEGYLYPETYLFARGTTETEIVDTLVRHFRDGYEREVAPLVAADPRLRDLGLRGLVTLASIVEKETQADDERAVVASVYTNRLRIGMPLQADPTVIYALKLRGTWDGNIRRPDLKLDHPYNTYQNPGLPPGPICSPTVDSLLAVAQPADTKYLYFVSRNDGTHAFARTLDEHNRNVYVWQKKYWRDKWARERAQGRGDGPG